MRSNLTPCLKYIWATTKHKWFVLQSGVKFHVPIWQLLVHDLSKYTPNELPRYGRQFFGMADDPEGFARAWLHHQNHNPHHWEFWIPRTTHFKGADAGTIANEPMEMPERYIREMCADWLGASRGYEGTYPESLRKLEMVPEEFRWHSYRKQDQDADTGASRRILFKSE